MLQNEILQHALLKKQLLGRRNRPQFHAARAKPPFFSGSFKPEECFFTVCCYFATRPLEKALGTTNWFWGQMYTAKRTLDVPIKPAYCNAPAVRKLIKGAV